MIYEKYVNPSIKTIELKIENIICQSDPDNYGASHDDMENGGEI